MKMSEAMQARQRAAINKMSCKRGSAQRALNQSRHYLVSKTGLGGG
jgi:hypothetical protein